MSLLNPPHQVDGNEVLDAVERSNLDVSAVTEIMATFLTLSSTMKFRFWEYPWDSAQYEPVIKCGTSNIAAMHTRMHEFPTPKSAFFCNAREYPDDSVPDGFRSASAAFFRLAADDDPYLVYEYACLNGFINLRYSDLTRPITDSMQPVTTYHLVGHKEVGPPEYIGSSESLSTLVGGRIHQALTSDFYDTQGRLIDACNSEVEATRIMTDKNQD